MRFALDRADFDASGRWPNRRRPPSAAPPRPPPRRLPRAELRRRRRRGTRAPRTRARATACGRRARARTPGRDGRAATTACVSVRVRASDGSGWRTAVSNGSRGPRVRRVGCGRALVVDAAARSAGVDAAPARPIHRRDSAPRRSSRFQPRGGDSGRHGCAEHARAAPARPSSGSSHTRDSRASNANTATAGSSQPSREQLGAPSTRRR